MGDESGSDSDSGRRVPVKYKRPIDQCGPDLVGKAVFVTLNKPAKKKSTPGTAVSAYSGTVVEFPFSLKDKGLDKDDPEANYVLMKNLRAMKEGRGPHNHL